MPTALGIAWLTATIVDFAQSHGIANLTINEAITAAEVDWEENDLAQAIASAVQGRGVALVSDVLTRKTT